MVDSNHSTKSCNAENMYVYIEKKLQVNKGNISGIIIIVKAIRKTRLRAFSSQNILDLPTQMINWIIMAIKYMYT